MPVYADVLFFINGFVNYLLILCTAKIIRVPASRLRILFGSLSGGIFAMKIFLPRINAIFEILLRIFICVMISLISFGYGSLGAFIKNTVTFLAVSISFGGIMYAAMFIFSEDVLIYDNAAVYFDIDLLTLCISAAVCFFTVSVAEKITARKSSASSVYTLEIEFGGKKSAGRALLDTGNSVKEVFSGSPVVISSYKSVKNIVPEEIKEYILSQVIPESSFIRMIPVYTVSSCGFLPSFKADRVTLRNADTVRERKDVYIAVSAVPVKSGEYEFLINNFILEETDNEQHKRHGYKKTDTSESTAENRERNILHKRTRDTASAAFKGR